MLVDLHSHSTPRSSCSQATLLELVDSAKRRGVDALCLTEHDIAWGRDDLDAASREMGMPLLAGVELSTDVGHVIAIGDLRRPLWLGYKFEQLVTEAEETGLALVLVHPVRREAGERAVRAGRVPPKPDAVVARPEWALVHAIEAGSTQTTRLEQTLTAAALTVHPRPQVAGSDAHAADLAGRYATRLQREVRTAAELASEIRAGRVEAVAVDPRPAGARME